MESIPRPRRTRRKAKIFNQIAENCGVSTATVTLALQDSARISDETKYRVYVEARKLAYRESKIRGNHHLNFALMHGAGGGGGGILSNSDIGIWYGAIKLIGEMDASVTIQELDLQDGAWTFSSLPSSFKRNQIDGVILTGTIGIDFIKFLCDANIPVVMASNLDIEVPVDQIFFDYEQGAYQSVKHLISRGRERIGFVSTGGGQKVNQCLLRGYRNAMEEAGLYRPEWVSLVDQRIEPTGKHAEQLLSVMERPEAVFATNHRSAYHMALSAALHGIQVDDPFELIAVNIDHRSEFRYRTHLLVPNTEALGRTAVQRLMDRREEKEHTPVVMMLKCELDLAPESSSIKS